MYLFAVNFFVDSFEKLIKLKSICVVEVPCNKQILFYCNFIKY